MFEVFTNVRLHILHYTLIVSLICLFYLLELALSEHLSFPATYGIAACIVIATNGAYAAALLSSRHAALLACVIAALYGLMFVLLQLKEHALLVESIALFLILAMIMYATRKVDWHAFGAMPTRSQEENSHEDVTAVAQRGTRTGDLASR